MRGTMFVKRLTKTGNYVSELDFDNSFSDISNPNGYFRMLIQPILNTENRYEIRYKKTKGGYIVSGEAYFVGGYDDSDIKRKLRAHKEKWNNLIQTEVVEDSDLF